MCTVMAELFPTDRTPINEGTIRLTAAQLSMSLEGIDYRMPAWTAPPEAVV